jgi:hypothetical protein
MTRSTLLKSIHSLPRMLGVLAALLAVVACGDSPTGPRSMDPDAVARVMPSVVDAQLRISPRLANAGLRQHVMVELQQLRSSMEGNNVPQARLSFDRIAAAIGIPGITDDAADVSALELMMYVVAPVIDGARYDIRFRAFP